MTFNHQALVVGLNQAHGNMWEPLKAFPDVTSSTVVKAPILTFNS